MPNLTQIRFTAKVIVPEGRQRIGAALWVSPERARSLIDQNVAEYVGAGSTPGAPTEHKPTGPMETQAKKPSGAGKAGRSTASRKSTEPGQAPPSSASPAAPALPPNSSSAWPWPGSAPKAD